MPMSAPAAASRATIPDALIAKLRAKKQDHVLKVRLSA